MAYGGDRVVVIRDFNAIRAHHEKEGGRAKSDASIQKFNDFINAGGLVDIGFEGEKFTWNNRQFGGNFIQERLDRALVSMAWRSEFSDVFVKHLDDLGSDHKAFLLCSHKEERGYKRRFRFQERWCENEEVVNLIKQAWRHEVVGSAMFKLVGKLKFCRHKLVEWQRTSNSNSNLKIMSLKEKISDETNKGQFANGATIRILEAELKEAFEQKERYWREKSRVQWLKWGDKNTKFFHSKFQARNRKNKIKELRDENGETASDAMDIAEIVQRLQSVMHRVISDSKSAFIKRRLISVNVLIAHEFMHSLKNKRYGDYELVLKLDMSKAYDRVEWNTF
ncbi:uncharacterized protein [Arachis hypogaea]|uniref:uncharacterized protein n=1 Tax=Arachis hypogaea TaxID=3818 RepID=UPI003B216FBC